MNTFASIDAGLTKTSDAGVRESMVENRKIVLKKRLIRELYEAGPLPIAHLARLLHTSVPSATTLIEELTAEKWLMELGVGETQFGRKPVLYGLNPHRHQTLILDISTHDTQLIVFDLNNEIVARLATDLRLRDEDAYLPDLLATITSFFKRERLIRQDLLAVGVSVPGLINPETGVNYTYPNLNQGGLSFGKRLEKYFGRPVFLINDTKATVLGEHRFGLAKGKKHVLSVNVDWGMGLGILLNGEVLTGASGFAGELGHIQVRTDGELCHCGKRGCLDTVASASALVRRVREDMQRGQSTQLTAHAPGAIDVEKVVDAARQGDAYSISVLKDISTEIGRGMAIAVQLFNPELIIVDGVLAKAGRFITEPLEQAIEQYCLNEFRNNLSIEISELGVMAKLFGTQAHLMENVLTPTQHLVDV